MTIEPRQVSPLGASYRTPLGVFGPGAAPVVGTTHAYDFLGRQDGTGGFDCADDELVAFDHRIETGVFDDSAILHLQFTPPAPEQYITSIVKVVTPTMAEYGPFPVRQQENPTCFDLVHPELYARLFDWDNTFPAGIQFAFQCTWGPLPGTQAAADFVVGVYTFTFGYA